MHILRVFCCCFLSQVACEVYLMNEFVSSGARVPRITAYLQDFHLSLLSLDYYLCFCCFTG